MGLLVLSGQTCFAGNTGTAISRSDEAGIAQLVRASVCGTEGRGFKSHYSPQIKKVRLSGLFYLT